MRALSTGLLLGLVGLGALAASQGQPGAPTAAPPFWEARPFEEWTPGETLALLTDSPWSRPATLVEPGVTVSPGKMRYYVQWYSAQTLREALVRLRHLQGRMDPTGEAQFLGAPRRAYQLYVFAAFFTDTGGLRPVPLDAFEGMTREELQASVQITFSAQEHASRPDRVELVRNAENQQLVGLRLSFERARAAVPPEQAREGQVRLVCPTKTGSLSASFLLGEMRRHGQPDL